MSKTKYGECEWDRLWSVKWIEMEINYEMNELEFGTWNE